jgi:hypothetical protein
MSGLARALPGRAVRVSMSVVNRTCVRKIGDPSDGTARTYVRPWRPWGNMAQPSHIPPSGSAMEVADRPGPSNFAPEPIVTLSWRDRAPVPAASML